MLQCYALQEWLCACGHDVSVLNYRPDYLDCESPKFRWWYLKPTSPLRSLKRVCRIFPALKRRHRLFETFENTFFRLTAPLTSKVELERVAAGYDCVMIGSDQVWNSQHNGADPVWYGDIGESLRLVAYAASAGDSRKEDLELLKDGLDRFAFVSVRESKLSEAVTEISPGYSLETVCDPVFLSDTKIWSNWLENKRKEPYVLIYQGRNNDSIIRIASEIAQKNNAEVVSVDCYANSFTRKVKHMDVGPDGFVSLVNNALCVVTSSFHAAAMSMILHTPFFVVRLDDGADDRAHDCLVRMGLAERMIGVGDSPDEIGMEFDVSDRMIQAERQKSREFIRRSLEPCI
jgi:hypothetical protein